MANIEARSEVNGSVWKLLVEPGAAVEAGDTLMLIESMKMEIPVIVEDGGRVVAILVKEGDAVAEGQVVAELEG
ncbi:MAG: biotin/lipoyl-binding carrier protein [Alphaproteobacteria bacterium]|nr:biotin/lipoyl-binding carrier protein [Alphaproteobacteria bacterium]